MVHSATLATVAPDRNGKRLLLTPESVPAAISALKSTADNANAALASIDAAALKYKALQRKLDEQLAEEPQEEPERHEDEREEHEGREAEHDHDHGHVAQAPVVQPGRSKESSSCPRRAMSAASSHRVRGGEGHGRQLIREGAPSGRPGWAELRSLRAAAGNGNATQGCPIS